MAIYKGVEIDESLTGLIQHISGVEVYRESLLHLQGVWDNLSLLGQLSGTGADMNGTREAFQQLTGSLLNCLGRETLKKTVLEMKSIAQVTVDILIRNLFERTADIGFLATDAGIRSYLEGLNGEAEPSLAARAKMEAHFHEYVRKYSVYSDIILLAPDGRVVAKLDPANPVTHSRDPLLAEALTTRASYVETFRPSDLQVNEAAPLIYSYRVTDAKGAPIGVLCLCFRFRDETDGIFARLSNQEDWAVISLLDATGRVIASSDGWHVPVGAQVERVLKADWSVVRFGGRQYLATTRSTQGYQGYLGPGWYGHIMLPLDHAFEHTGGGSLGRLDPAVLAGVMANSDLFNPGLQAIPAQAEQIQRVLNRSVWNGNVRHRADDKALNPAFSKVLLWEISNTGLKTKDVFERSIGNLHETVVSAILENSRFLASLTIDIMDRNLYERANDCRWWALTAAFREKLAGEMTEAHARDIAEILSYINGLYTVYDNLLVFDRQGRVVAVSNPEQGGLVGQLLAEDWVRQTLAPRDSQSYAVSNFAATPLYRNRPTYIYTAAIRSPDEHQVVGGIGIVFDSAPQFEAMLRDALPRDEDGEILRGSFGVIAREDRRLIAATGQGLAPGDELDIPEEYFQMAEEQSGIVAYRGNYYAVGTCPSRGYREYKSETDAYRNNVSALIFIPLGKCDQQQAGRAEPPPRPSLASMARNGDGNGIEIATFHVAGQWLGVGSDCVVEAIEARGITSVPGVKRNLFGYAMFRNRVMPVINLAVLLGSEAPLSQASLSDKQIVVLKDTQEDNHIGLLIDQLGDIPEVPADRIEKLTAMMGGEHQLADSMVKKRDSEPSSQMLVLLSVERLRARLQALHLQAEALSEEA
ncbi:MAG: chemotaxis protein CheW [Hydrogenophilales bacterium 28-61-23]|nr:MAG: chemotaxis protein CheW [Hydrogenophilales bacterium 28-61-23]